jgi:hypothetical protein
MIDDSIRTLEYFADLGCLELRHDTSGKRKEAYLLAATGQPINYALGEAGEFWAM